MTTSRASEALAAPAVAAGATAGRASRTRLSGTVGASVGALTAVGVAGLLVPLRDELGNTNVALVLVVVVVGAALVGGRIAGAATSVAAAVAFNFFHTQPYRSLRVHSDRDIWTVVLLVVVGVVVGEVAVLADRRGRAVEEHRSSSTAVHRVAEALVDGSASAVVQEMVLDAVREELHLRSVRFEPGPPVTALPELGHTGAVATLQHVWTGDGFALPAQGVELLVRQGPIRFGRLVLEPTPGAAVDIDRRRLAVALADLLAVSLGRVGSPAP
jgi:K+-sensing histidine kinase KdpD